MGSASRDWRAWPTRRSGRLGTLWKRRERVCEAGIPNRRQQTATSLSSRNPRRPRECGRALQNKRGRSARRPAALGSSCSCSIRASWSPGRRRDVRRVRHDTTWRGRQDRPGTAGDRSRVPARIAAIFPAGVTKQQARHCCSRQRIPRVCMLLKARERMRLDGQVMETGWRQREQAPSHETVGRPGAVPMPPAEARRGPAWPPDPCASCAAVTALLDYPSR